MRAEAGRRNTELAPLRGFVAGVLLALAAPAMAQVGSALCGPLENAYGPFDYRTERDKLHIVEGAHFTPEVEKLIRGRTGTLGADIDYTLRAAPNHHRALVSISRLGERLKRPRVPGALYDTECYFVRAMKFRPDDTVARMLYARYLIGQKRQPEALEHLATVGSQAGENPFTHYNLGLIYLELGALDKALAQAHQAQALGFPRTELKNALVAANKWVEPPPAAASAPASAASAP